MKEILEEIINEAKEGFVIIDNDPFPIGFNSSFEIKNEYFPTLNVNNIEEIAKYLELYILEYLNTNPKLPNFITEKEKNTKKIIISYLFCNATETPEISTNLNTLSLHDALPISLS